jgi:pyruvate dehydrogenase E2 component (dihydrolipoamide acetyltransferase)
MAEIVMPRLSDTMEEGTVLRWLKRDGEQVRRGEELVEIETDKATMAYESDQDGVLEIVAREGDTLAVGAVIAHVGDVAGADGAQDAPGADEARDTAGVESTQAGESRSTAGQQPGVPATARPAEPDAATGHDAERVRASPLARRIARESGVDLNALTGSGPGGRIVKADVEAAGRPTRTGPPVVTASAPPLAAPAAPSEAPATRSGGPATTPEAQATLAERVATAKGEATVVELTRTQRTIARRMAESKATIPDFALQMEIDMVKCVALRSELKRLSPLQAPTYNDMVVKACALALREHPRANGSYRDGRLELHSRVNVGVAVAVAAAPGDRPPAAGTAGGGGDPGHASGAADLGDALVVPTVFDADLKSLGEIARETRALAERVRAATIAPPELGGGTFTVSNLGMYGVRSFTAIVNPPQAAILSVGALEPRAVVRDDEIVARHTLAVTLACDHRILYGADAARFLARIRELLEEPAALTL